VKGGPWRRSAGPRSTRDARLGPADAVDLGDDAVAGSERDLDDDLAVSVQCPGAQLRPDGSDAAGMDGQTASVDRRSAPAR
jgi:hypothetical protein